MSYSRRVVCVCVCVHMRKCPLEASRSNVQNSPFFDVNFIYRSQQLFGDYVIEYRGIFAYHSIASYQHSSSLPCLLVYTE